MTGNTMELALNMPTALFLKAKVGMKGGLCEP